MSSDYWRKKDDQDRRSGAFYRAVRKKNWDVAVHAAAPDKYLDYLEMKGRPSGADSGSKAKRPELSQELQDEVRQFQESLGVLISCVKDVLTRANLISEVFAIERSDPKAFEKLEQLRNRILRLLPA